jgi:hypothetical protein
VNNKLPSYNLNAVKTLFDKYYKFKDENICYTIKFDSSGAIIGFEFLNPVDINKQFMKELKRIKANHPAIFHGKNIAIDYFDCINYMN